MKYNKHNLIYYSNLYKNILCFILFSQIILSCKQENIRNDSNSLSIITNADSLYYYYRPYFVVHIQDSADIEKYFLDQKNNIAKNELFISLHNIELENEFFKSFNRYDKITYLEFRYFKSNIDIIKLSQFTNLKYLSFYDAKIENQTSFFNELSNLKCLESLSLIDCKLNNILDENIGKLKFLKCLNLDDDSISILPYNIGFLKRLEFLGVSTKLNKLPNSIGKLKMLKELDLGNNSLNEFPICILELDNLVSLNLEFNPIESIPVELKNLKKLKKVGLLYTKLDKIQRESFLINENIKEIERNSRCKMYYREYHSGGL